MMSPTDDRPTRSGLLPATYPNTAESGDTYDIDLLTQPIRTRRLAFRNPSLRASLTLLDTAESGDAYDAEVEQFFSEELEDWSAPRSVPSAQTDLRSGS